MVKQQFNLLCNPFNCSLIKGLAMIDLKHSGSWLVSRSKFSHRCITRLDPIWRQRTTMPSWITGLVNNFMLLSASITYCTSRLRRYRIEQEPTNNGLCICQKLLKITWNQSSSASPRAGFSKWWTIMAEFFQRRSTFFSLEV